MKRTILGHEFEVEEKELLVSQLKFSPDNPRVYSVLNDAGDDPSQGDIERHMCRLEHVKQLKESIRANGGVLEPIIVKGNIVLEGNSRLAAYRLLNREVNSLQWKKIQCLILPDDTDDKYIFTLLGEYHIVGRKDWDPYEQAYYLYRRFKAENESVDFMARELGRSKQEVKKMIDVISFMKKYDDADKSHWSYYEEYIKSNSLKPFRRISECLNDTMAEAIKGNKIKRAEDIRLLGNIARVNDKESDKLIQKFASQQMDLYEVVEQAETKGKLDDVVKHLRRFRKIIIQDSIIDQILSSDEVKKNARFEINKILKRLEKIQKSIN